MTPSTIVIRFEQVADQFEGPVRRLVGFVRAKYMLQLFDAANLEANPRSAKAGSVTADIIESIKDSPETFPFKTKGILVGASRYKPLQRNRYELHFENTRIEGVLDGGHNMLAVGSLILERALGDEKEFKKLKVKLWPDLKSAWEEHRDAIEVLRKAEQEDNADGLLDFLVPIEVLVPSSLDDDEIVAAFNSSLLDICAARNNNVELTLETRANKKGFYEHLRKNLPPMIADRIEWKTNDGGEIKVRDVIALAWIPLSLIDLSVNIKIPPQNIYRNKGGCVQEFDRLMSDESVSRETDDDYTHELHNSAVQSALVIAGQIPALYDKIYRDFPYAYNDNDGKFGRINVVKLAKDMRTKPTSHFLEEEVEYNYPDGLIVPLVYGLKALMAVDRKGHVRWKEDPAKFLDDCLGSIVKKYRVVLDAYRFDPQKIGKNEGSYELVVDAYETELLKRKAAA